MGAPHTGLLPLLFWCLLPFAPGSFSAFCGTTPASPADTARFGPSRLRCEDRVDPLGIDARHPRLSWELEETTPGTRGEMQTAFQVLVATRPELLEQGRADLWDSGKVVSSQSLQIEYAGKPLLSHLRCVWKVRAWDTRDRPTAWSAQALWSMGLLEEGDWHGHWVGLDEGEAGEEGASLEGAHWIWYPGEDAAAAAAVGAVRFRRVVEVPPDREVETAVVALTADNRFTLFVDGVMCSSGSSFHQVQEVEITKRLRPGPIVIAVEAANEGQGPNPAGLIGRLRIRFTDGAPLAIATDKSWKCTRSAPEGWETARFDDSSWAAAQALGADGMAPWGTLDSRSELRRLPARHLRKEFEVPGAVRRATAYVAGLGLFELEVNGERVGDDELVPALTEYTKRVLYLTYDVTERLRSGENALGVLLGNGRFFAPRLRVPTLTRSYGYPKLLLELRVELEDGSSIAVTTDESWKVTDEGPIRANSEYDGEEYDARMELPGWSRPGYDDSAWQNARRVEPPGGALRSQGIAPIRVMEFLLPVSVTRLNQGTYVFDMGQNMVGWCRLKVAGPTGTKVSLRYAETLRPDGTLYLDNIRSARVTDTYTLKGGGVESWEPRFTYHGFRHVEVSGWPSEPRLEDLEGCVVHDALEPVGTFESSNPLLDRIHRNISWGLRGNYRSVPTDCPQRDERQGWLGDRSAESSGEAYLFDVAAFYAKWLQDIEDAQKENGSLPDVAPAYWPIYSDNVTWPSSFIIIPGMLHERYGDLRTIRDRYPAMKRWSAFMSGFIKDGILARDTYGDWCVPPEEQHLIHSKDPARKTPGDLIATAYFFHDLTLLSRYAALLGKEEDRARFAGQAATMKQAFLARFYDATTAKFANGSQTSSILPLAFGLTPEDPLEQKRIFDGLVEKILGEGNGHIGTGLIGAQWLLGVLSDGGRPDVAYGMATKEAYPGWGYMIGKGATTIWELWNGDSADPAMNSGNHVMLVGDLLTWLYERLGGLRPSRQEPGFESLQIRPCPVGDLTRVKVAHRSARGSIRSEWRLRGGAFELDIFLPINTRAEVHVPSADSASVTEGGRPAAESPGVRFLRLEDGRTVWEVGSGRYRFAAPYAPRGAP